MEPVKDAMGRSLHRWSRSPLLITAAALAACAQSPGADIASPTPSGFSPQCWRFSRVDPPDGDAPQPLRLTDEARVSYSAEWLASGRTVSSLPPAYWRDEEGVRLIAVSVLNWAIRIRLSDPDAVTTRGVANFFSDMGRPSEYEVIAERFPCEDDEWHPVPQGLQAAPDN